jgi:tetratricopeptide (TPR) repeat protein
MNRENPPSILRVQEEMVSPLCARNGLRGCEVDMSEATIFQQPPIRRPGNPLKLSALAALFRKTWLHIAALAVTGFTVHIPAFQGQPIWDDDYLIRTNPLIKSPLLILETFRHYLFLDSYSPHYRPVQDLSYMLDYALWNDNTYGFHLTNVLLHVGSAILLYLLLRKLLRSLLDGRGKKGQDFVASSAAPTTSSIAFFIALLWVVHPIHSAAIDYISGRADSLAFLFACGGWLLFLKAKEFSQPLFRYLVFAGAWLSGLLALCSRESACIWIILFLIYLWGFERSVEFRRKGMVLLACLALFGTYACLRSLPEPRTQKQPSAGWALPVRAILMCRALGDYSRLMIFPSNLHMERTVFDPRTSQNKESRYGSIELEYLSVIGVLVGGALVFGALRKGTGQKLRILGSIWFLFSYLPTSNLVDLNATVAEHWLYLPSVGFLIFLAGVVLDLPLSWRKASIVFACFAIFGLGVRSYLRSGDWISSEVFARKTMGAGGATVRLSLILGQAYLEQNNYAEAERVFRKALELCPDYPLARNNLADVLWRQGKEKEARVIFESASKAAHESRQDYPRTWIAALNLAHFRHGQQDDPGALAALETARHDYPGTWELISFESELLRQASKLDEAIAIVHPFAQNNWWHFGAALALGRLYAEKDEVDLADAALRRASWLDVHDTQALNLIAMIRSNQNHLDEAYAAQRRAVSRQPDKPQQYVMLSKILEKMGRNDEARAAREKVSRLCALAEIPVAAN